PEWFAEWVKQAIKIGKGPHPDLFPRRDCVAFWEERSRARFVFETTEDLAMSTLGKVMDKKETPELGHRDTQNLVPGHFGIRGTITHAVVIKEGDLFFLCEPDGGVPL